MNLTDYFEPVDFSKLTATNLSLGKYGMRKAVEKFSETINKKSLAKTDVILMGVPVYNGKRQKRRAFSPDFIRSNFYQLASLEPNLKITDLGNLKEAKSYKGTLLAIRDIVEYLREIDAVVVILGGSHDLTLGICDAFMNERFFWLSVVDAVLDVKKGKEVFNSQNFLTRLFRKFPHLFQFSLIGYQQHLTGEQLIKNTTDNCNHLRLGELRYDNKHAELLLRNSNVLSFDMGALKNSSISGTNQRRVNGLEGEEACQLAHYAGLSPRLSVFGLFETDNEKKDGTASAIAGEIIWYFLKGVSARKQSGTRTAYKVEIEGMDQPVVFRHERELNRWWFDVRSISGEIIEIACSEDEYKQAASNEIPERWLKFLQKMDNLPK